MRHWLPLILLLVMGASEGSAAIDKARLRWARSHPIIDSIAVDGNVHFSDGEIRSRLYSRERTVWLAIKGDRRSRVQRETRGRDTLEAKFLYVSEGFLQARVEHEFEPIGKDSAALVRITVTEGPQCFLGKTRVTGDHNEEMAGRIGSVISRLKIGQAINLFDLNDARFDIKTLLANRGHPYAQVDYQIDSSSGYNPCSVTFSIVQDSLVYFGQVSVEGTDNYPEYAARRELKIEPGQMYRREDILESQRRLFESGYFTTFQLRQVEGVGDRLNPEFTLRVRERKARQITFNTGAAQSEVRDLLWDVSGAYGRRNFLGSRRYDLLADYSFSVGSDSRLIKHRYRLRFTEPWFLGFRMPLSLTAQLQPRTRHAVQSFDRRSWSVAAVLNKRFGLKIRTSLGGEYQNVKISGVAQDSIQQILTEEGISARRKLYATFRRDSRNDLFIPSHGSLVEISGDFFGGFLGGDDNFFKVQASWSRYQIVWPGWIFASRVRAGWAEEFGESQAVPLDEALYLGGANTVRGFDENMLGPLLADGTPAGAQFTLVVNQEFRWRTLQFHRALPLIGSLFATIPLWQSVFVDVGNGFTHERDMRFENLAIAYGTGFQFVSPAGPIRIDYAQVLEHHKIDFAHRWHFTILYAF